MPKIQTVRFGELDYRQADVIHLPEGLVGMPDLSRWLVLEMGDGVPMKWFQSLDRGDFGFPVSQPAFFTDTYDVDIPASSASIIKGEEGEWIAILIITTVQDGGTKITGNLLAPLVVNVDTRQGIQLVMKDPHWSMKQEINYLKFGLAVDAQASENDPQTVDGENHVKDLLDSSDQSGQSQVRPEVESPEPAEV